MASAACRRPKIIIPKPPPPDSYDDHLLLAAVEAESHKQGRSSQHARGFSWRRPPKRSAARELDPKLCASKELSRWSVRIGLDPKAITPVAPRPPLLRHRAAPKLTPPPPVLSGSHRPSRFAGAVPILISVLYSSKTPCTCSFYANLRGRVHRAGGCCPPSPARHLLRLLRLLLE